MTNPTAPDTLVEREDIAKRLGMWALARNMRHRCEVQPSLLSEAAKEITTLRAELRTAAAHAEEESRRADAAEARVAELERGLEPFARFYVVAQHLQGCTSPMEFGAESHIAGEAHVRVEDFRLARRLLAKDLGDG